jgi:hypothetical protein
VNLRPSKSLEEARDQIDKVLSDNKKNIIDFAEYEIGMKKLIVDFDKYNVDIYKGSTYDFADYKDSFRLCVDRDVEFPIRVLANNSFIKSRHECNMGQREFNAIIVLSHCIDSLFCAKIPVDKMQSCAEMSDFVLMRYNMYRFLGVLMLYCDSQMNIILRHVNKYCRFCNPVGLAAGFVSATYLCLEFNDNKYINAGILCLQGFCILGALSSELCAMALLENNTRITAINNENELS